MENSPASSETAPETAAETATAPADSDTSRLADILGDDLVATENVLQNELRSHIAQIHSIASHLTRHGGKRLRPLLTLAAARLSDAPPREMHRIHKLAAAVELLHSATLLHDDVVDDAKLRRGRASANRVWGNKSSVLTGDFLLARAFALMVAADSKPALEILSNAATVVANGEMLGLLAQARTDLTREEIFEVLSCKTARLFSAATEAGACLHADARCRAGLAEFGFNIGLAFQLVDDVLDYEVSAKLMGKSPGDDLRERRMTLPVWIAFQDGDGDERDFWVRTIERGEFRPGDFGRARGILRGHGALERVRGEAAGYLREASVHLGGYGASPLRDALESLLRVNAARIN
ncbi:MAG: polyprenyl synthetase family protein [Alphaproteobacteria bacterium]|nr:polyprenyl synthetase family protein [Alphaproteobacteria bacterium]MDA8003513.1 polyprenyl synthetase family protein [Alphaproteobacteria bacterium]MDA8005504.1 polyprenyl synthetase family protein [Alphaproteobacteria bacterium]MDA8013768.1 polyprenyl synthetase family protein [Alphaproteobacteria bacterium]